MLRVILSSDSVKALHFTFIIARIKLTLILTPGCKLGQFLVGSESLEELC
jgi:hypothetical protein